MNILIRYHMTSNMKRRHEHILLLPILADIIQAIIQRSVSLLLQNAFVVSLREQAVRTELRHWEGRLMGSEHAVVVETGEGADQTQDATEDH